MVVRVCCVVVASLLLAACGHYDNEVPTGSSSACALSTTPDGGTVAPAAECHDVTHLSP